MKAVDMHCDTVSRLYGKRKKMGGDGETLFHNSGHVDVEKLKKGDVLLQNFALFVDRGKTKDAFEEAGRMADYYYAELYKNREYIAPVFTFADIEKNKSDGKISALLTVEEGAVCRGSVDLLHRLYGWGVRMMTLTWNYPNEIGYPNLDARHMGQADGEPPFYLQPDEKHGLTKNGAELVEEMERIGMMIDVSHLADAGFYDVLALTKKPFAASHSNARTVCPWVRNLTDDMIRKLAERGGVIGLNFCPDFLEEAKPGEENAGTVSAIVRHARHIVDVGGVDCIGLGSDFDGIDGHGELPDCSFLPRLSEALSAAGFTQKEVEKIFSGNVLRFYRELL